MANETTSGGGGFLSLLAVLFIGLKLTDHIDWSWWWILSPLWIPAALMLGLFGLAVVGVAAADWHKTTRLRR